LPKNWLLNKKQKLSQALQQLFNEVNGINLQPFGAVADGLWR